MSVNESDVGTAVVLLQSFEPHVVLQPHPNGTCVKVYETRSYVFSKDIARGGTPRGNTQAQFVSTAFTGERRDYYLGIVHMEIKKEYYSYFYKMQVCHCCAALGTVVSVTGCHLLHATECSSGIPKPALQALASS